MWAHSNVSRVDNGSEDKDNTFLDVLEMQQRLLPFSLCCYHGHGRRCCGPRRGFRCCRRSAWCERALPLVATMTVTSSALWLRWRRRQNRR